MNYQNIENLNSEQRDHLLSQLLVEQAERLKGQPPTPSSEAGRAALQTSTDLLLEDVYDGRISDALLSAMQSLEVELDDALTESVIEQSFISNEDIDSAVSLEVIGNLALCECKLRDIAEDKFGNDLLSKVGASVSACLDSHVFSELRTEITDTLPELIQQSVSWRIDTCKIRDALSDHIHSFMTDTVLPDVAHNICDAEVDMMPILGAVHDPSNLGLELGEGGVDLVGGASHG